MLQVFLAFMLLGLIYIYDLFSGSLLLSCAHYGAYTIGTDINKVLLHGRGELLPGISSVILILNDSQISNDDG